REARPAAARPAPAGATRAPRRPARACLLDSRRGRMRSCVSLGLPGERPGADPAGVVAREHLDALLGVLEVSRAAPGQSHALLEDRQRFFEREIPPSSLPTICSSRARQSSNLRSVILLPRRGHPRVEAPLL